MQTTVITLTLLVFIFQFRSQEKAIKESSYQNLMGRYNDYIMSGEDSDNLILAQLLAPDQTFTERELSSIRRLMIAYGIIEEAYELYSKRWIDKDAWAQWDAWLQALVKHPQFRKLHLSTTGMFDKGYQDYVTSLIRSDSSSSPS